MSLNANATLSELVEVLENFRPQANTVDRAGHLIIDALRAGKKILTCGNGGSAADALHMAEEFVGRYRSNRRSLPAICLAADVTALTCIGNDFGFDALFSRQIEGLSCEGDVLVAFTTSGRSKNIVQALEAGKKAGLKTILLAGGSGGICKNLADNAIIVESQNGARIQETHTLIMHHWLEMVEAESW